jgi:predicted RNase H-like HicB family nuclease
MKSRLVVAVGRDAAGRWVGNVAHIPGVQARGKTRTEAVTRVRARALHALAKQVESGEQVPEVGQLLPDAHSSTQEEQLGQAGAVLAGAVWNKDDFSDWEGAPNGKGSPR